MVGLLFCLSAGFAGGDGPAAELPQDVPDFYVSQLTIDGTVVDDRAELTIDLRLYITRPGVWQEVPLRLQQATVVSRDYDGTGDAAPVLTAAPINGLAWKFRGAGQHRLRLGVLVPLQPAPDGQRLTLTLPTLPPQFRGTLDLTVPVTGAEFTSADLDLAEVETRADRTRVKAFLPGGGSPAVGSRLSLAWSRPPDVAYGTVSSVRSEIDVRPTENGGRLRMTVDQLLKAGAGGLSVVRMSVPTDFAFDDVVGPRVVAVIERPDESPSRRPPRWVTVQLDNAPEPAASLRWTFSRRMEEAERSFRIDGLGVETAVRESGEIRIHEVANQRVRVDWDAAVGTRRIAADLPTVVAAAQFSRQPIDVPVSISDEPLFTVVVPQTDLTFRRGAAELASTFDIAVESGQLSKIQFDWPKSAVVNWQSLSASLGEPPTPVAVSPDGRTIVLPEPAADSLRVQLFGRVSVGEAPFASLGLPRVIGTSERPTLLTVLAEDAVDVEIAAEDEARLGPPPPSRQPEEGGPPGDLRMLSRHLVYGEPASIAARIHRRELQALVASRLVLTPSVSPQLGLVVRSEQRLDYRVTGGRLGEVEIVLPADFLRKDGEPADWVTVLVDGNPLPAASVVAGAGGAIRLRLPSPSVEFSVSLPATEHSAGAGRGMQAGTVVPLLRPAGVELASLELRAMRPNVFRLTPRPDVGVSWSRSPVVAEDGQSWYAKPDEAPASLAVVVSEEVADVAPTYHVASAVVRIAVDETAARVSASYELEGYPDEVAIRLPNDAVQPRFTWNDGEAAEPAKFGRDGQFAIAVPGEASTLTAVYAAPVGRDLFGAFNVGLPRLSGDPPVRTVEVSLQTPADHFLLNAPPTLRPAFRWMRDRLWLSRQGVGGSRLSETGINVYRFETPWYQDELRFATVRGLPLILLGATPAVLLTFLLSRLPRRITLFVLLAACLCVAAAAWLIPGIVVFAQPAAAGAACGLVAAAATRRRSPVRPVLRVVSGSPRSGSTLTDARSAGTVMAGSVSAPTSGSV